MTSKEELESGNDISLPTIDDLPFGADLAFETDIDFGEANEQFLEQYGDLLETIDVDEVDDIGLQTLIQGLPDTARKSETTAIQAPETEKKKYVLESSEQTEFSIVETYTMHLPDQSDHIGEFLTTGVSVTSSPWQESFKIVEEKVDDLATSNAASDQFLSLTDPAESLLPSSATDTDRESTPSGWEIPQEATIDSVIDELETILQDNWEEPVVEPVENIENTDRSWESGFSESTSSTPPLLITDTDRESTPSGWEIPQEATIDSVIDELETILQDNWEEPVVEPVENIENTDRSWESGFSESTSSTPPLLITDTDRESTPSGWEIPQEATIDSVIDELETILQDNWEEPEQPLAEPVENIENTDRSWESGFSESASSTPPLATDTDREINSLNWDMDSFAEEPAESDIFTQEKPKQEEIASPPIPPIGAVSPQEVSELSPVSAQEEEEDNYVFWDVEEEDGAGLGAGDLLQSATTTRDPNQEDRLDVAWDIEESSLEEGIGTHEFSAEKWNEEAREPDGVLAFAETPAQEDALSWELSQMEDSPENAVPEPVQFKSAANASREKFSGVNEDMPVFIDDEDSAIDEIITAFQMPKQKEEEPEAEYAYEESEEYFEEGAYDSAYQLAEEEAYDPAYPSEEEEWEPNSYQPAVGSADYADDYEEWQSDLHSGSSFGDDEDSAIDEIITTFQFGDEEDSKKRRNSPLDDSEAAELLTRWKDDGNDYNDPKGGTSVIDWEKVAESKSGKFDELSIDFNKFSDVGASSFEEDDMPTEIRAQRALQRTENQGLLDSVQFDEHDGAFDDFDVEPEPSLPPLPPRPSTLKTDLRPRSTTSFEVAEKSPPKPPRSLEGKDLEKKLSFEDVSDDDWTNLLDEIPPVTDEMFGLSEQTANNYVDSEVPHQFVSQGFQSGETQPANLHINSPSSFESNISQTAPTFPEVPPPSVRVQMFLEDHGVTIRKIGIPALIILVVIGVFGAIFSNPRVNRSTTVLGLRIGIWKSATNNKNLRGVDLKGANLQDVDFSGSDLSGSNLIETNLRSAKLEGTTLVRTNFKNSRLNLANFKKANLMGATLEGSDLSKTDFRGAKLSQAKLKNRKWAPENAPISDKETTCPNGKKGPCRFFLPETYRWAGCFSLIDP